MGVEIYLNRAREMADRKGLPFDEKRAIDIYARGLAEGFRVYFRSAEAEAERGLPQDVERSLKVARHYAREAGIRFDEQLARQIWQRALATSVRAGLREIENYAGVGNAWEMEVSWVRVMAQAPEVGIVVDNARLSEIALEGYRKGIEVAFREAGTTMPCGCNGESSREMEWLWEPVLQEAERFAREAGVPFDRRRAAKIRTARRQGLLVK